MGIGESGEERLEAGRSVRGQVEGVATPLYLGPDPGPYRLLAAAFEYERQIRLAEREYPVLPDYLAKRDAGMGIVDDAENRIERPALHREERLEGVRVEESSREPVPIKGAGQDLQMGQVLCRDIFRRPPVDAQIFEFVSGENVNVVWRCPQHP